MRFLCIASGSSGNSTYIGSENTHLLIDAGISNKRIVEGLQTADICPQDLSGILITHEHSDHISGLKVFLKKFQIPLYATSKTIEAIRRMGIFAHYEEDLLRSISADSDFAIGDLQVHSFGISHDAADPVAYRVSCGKKSAVVATDMGHFTEDIVKNLQDVDIAVIEANHDIRMLECGPYPYALKRRILGDKGHLSNENAGKLITKFLHDNIRHIFLGHLSKENNHPEIAYQAVKYEIDTGECKYKGSDFLIEVAKRDMPSTLVAI